jgi:hypothetical protein
LSNDLVSIPTTRRRRRRRRRKRKETRGAHLVHILLSSNGSLGQPGSCVSVDKSHPPAAGLNKSQTWVVCDGRKFFKRPRYDPVHLPYISPFSPLVYCRLFGRLFLLSSLSLSATTAGISLSVFLKIQSRRWRFIPPEKRITATTIYSQPVNNRHHAPATQRIQHAVQQQQSSS